jgi:hypothetical protein
MAIQALKSGSLYLIEPNHFGIVHVDGNPSLRAQNDLFSCGHLENVLPYSSRHSQGPARPLSEIPTPPATAGVDVGLVLLQPAGHGLTDRFHLVGNLRIDSALARTGELLLRGVSQRHRNRVVQGSQARRKKRKKARTDCPGPFLSSLVRYWCGAKQRAESLMAAQAVPR